MQGEGQAKVMDKRTHKESESRISSHTINKGAGRSSTERASSDRPSKNLDNGKARTQSDKEAGRLPIQGASSPSFSFFTLPRRIKLADYQYKEQARTGPRLVCLKRKERLCERVRMRETVRKKKKE